MIKFELQRPQTRLDVAQASAKDQLRERHAEKLIPTRKAARTTVSFVSPHSCVEIVPRNKLHDLSEHEICRVHAPFSTDWDQSPEVGSDNSSRYRAPIHCDSLFQSNVLRQNPLPLAGQFCSHLTIHDTAAALDALPNLTGPAPEAARMTETDPATIPMSKKVAPPLPHAGDGSGRRPSIAGTDNETTPVAGGCRNSFEVSGLDAFGQEASQVPPEGLEPSTR